MSTPSTPAPGTPEWLRKLADSTDEMGRGLAEAFGEPVPDSYGEEAAGLRAAAERLEELTAKTCEYAAEIVRLRAEVLAYCQAFDAQPWATDEPARVLLDRITAELNRLRAENEALRDEDLLLSERALRLCHAIEQAPASEQLTKCSVLAAQLRVELETYEATRPLTEHEQSLVRAGWEAVSGDAARKEGA